MTLPALAAALLAAAACTAALPTLACLGLALLPPALWRWLPRTWRPVILAFPLCVCWCVLRQIPGPGDLRRELPREARSIDLTYRVAGDADLRTFPGRPPVLQVPVSAVSRETGGGPEPVRGRMLLRLPAEEETAPPAIGSHWRATGVLRPANRAHVGLFRSDWEYRPDPGTLQRVSTPVSRRPLELFFTAREALANRISAALSGHPREAQLLRALLLGERSGVPDADLEAFARTGLIHVFAISGLHMGMLAGLLLTLMRVLRVPARWQGVSVVPFLVLFALCSGMRASSLRALVMLACLLTAPAWYRRPNLVSAFALAVVGVLGVAPAQVMDPGFQFSFLLVAGLIGFAGRFEARVRGWIAPDPWAAPDAGREFRHHRIWPAVTGSVVVSCLCVALSAPLTARYFNLFSPVGLLGNLLAVPLVFGILATGFPALLLSLLPFGWASAGFAPAAGLAGVLLRWVDLIDRIPFGSQWVAAPPGWQVLAGYGLVALLLWHPAWTRLWGGALAGLTLFAVAQRIPAPGAAEVWVLPAERGQCVLLRTGFRPAVLVDAGSEWSGWDIARELKRRGVDRVGTWIFTHPDTRHTGGAEQVLEVVRPVEVLAFAGDAHSFAFEPGMPPVREVTAGRVLDLHGWRVEVLHPEADDRSGRADDRSLVLRFSRGFRSVLVLGGAGAGVERELLATGRARPAAVVLAGHPREEDRLIPPFLEAVDPGLAVFSGEAFEGISPARREAEQRVAESAIPLVRVPGDGFFRFAW